MNEPLQGLTSLLRRVYHYGHRYRCPLCHARVRRFLPYGDDHPVLREKRVIGAGRRPNASCPVCGSLDRDRLLYLYLRHRTPVFRTPLKLLHMAPERALQKILGKEEQIDYVTADLSRDDVMVKADLNNLPFASDEFDAVICNHVLEYLADDRRALAEIRRVLKPGGWAIIQEQIAMSLETTYEESRPLTQEEQYELYGEPGHVRLYGKDYHRRIEEAGFRVEVFQWSADDETFGGPANTMGLLEGECVDIAFKHA